MAGDDAVRHGECVHDSSGIPKSLSPTARVAPSSFRVSRDADRVAHPTVQELYESFKFDSSLWVVDCITVNARDEKWTACIVIIKKLTLESLPIVRGSSVLTDGHLPVSPVSQAPNRLC